MRVTFLSNYPVPYQREFLRAVELEGRLEVFPFFLESKDPVRLWPPDQTIARARVPRSLASSHLPRELRIYPRLLSEMRTCAPDITIVCGYSHLAFQNAIASLAARRSPFVIWAEFPRTGTGNLPRRVLRRLLISPLNLASGLLAVGTRAALRWRGLLRPSVPIANLPYTCDTDRYFAISRSAAPREAFTFLFSGQLIERKGLDLLLRAFAEAASLRSSLRLLVAGDGPQRQALEAMVPAWLHDRVRFLGFVSWEQLPSVYESADALVVPSRHDGWGLVVNEALAAGIPVIASDTVGAALDLIRDGQTGSLVPCGDLARLTQALLEMPARAAAMRPRCRELARRLTPRLAAQRLASLLEAAARGDLGDSLEAYS